MKHLTMFAALAVAACSHDSNEPMTPASDYQPGGRAYGPLPEPLPLAPGDEQLPAGADSSGDQTPNPELRGESDFYPMAGGSSGTGGSGGGKGKAGSGGTSTK